MNNNIFDAPKPIFGDSDEFEDIGQSTIRITWGTPSISGRTLTGTIAFSGLTANVFGDDFRIVNASGTVQSDWSINRSLVDHNGNNNSWGAPNRPLTITATGPSEIHGSFGFRLLANSVRDGGTSGPAFPATASNSPRIDIDNRPIDVTWATPTDMLKTREITAVVTFSRDPGSAFSVTDDFSVEKRDGSTWNTDTGWTLSSEGTGAIRTIKATPSDAVTDGTYRIVLAQNAFGSGLPATAMATAGQSIGASPTTLDGNDQFTLTMRVPENSRGSMQISVKAREFHVTGDSNAVGPATQQYLGTIDYNRELIPQIADTEYSGVAITGDNDFGVDFNTEVSGFNSDAIEIDGVTGISLLDMNITYAITPSDDTPANRPSVGDRNTEITGTTRAKYFRVRVPLTADQLPQGVMTLRLKPGIVNND